MPAREWLKRWFAARGPLPGATPEEQLATDYFEAGLLDSLSVVGLVVDLEKAFGVRFSNRHYQDRRFATIGGLAELVEELSAAPARLKR